MSARARDIEPVLDRLSRVLPERAPGLWESLRSPVTGADLDALRRAIEPYELPHEVVAMLCWADGQDDRRGWPPWWPTVSCGPLLSAARIVEMYRFLLDETEDWQWTPLWLPVAHDGWNQAGVEMTVDRPGAVVDASFGNAAVNVVAPSLAAMLDATADMIDAGVSLEQPRDHDDVRRRAALIDTRDDWVTWPYDRIIAYEVAAWPPHWRAAIGLPAEPEAPRLPTTPVRDVLDAPTDHAEPSTIEGYVTDRVLIDNVASGGYMIITLDDGTAAAHVRFRPDTPGNYWASWIGRRIQIDVLAGRTAAREIDAALDAVPERRNRSPAGRCLLAREARVGVQPGG
jgi:hypothetical protein